MSSRGSSRRHSPRYKSRPLLDKWSLLPLVMSGCCVAASIFIFVGRHKPLPFCSTNVQYGKNCIKCSKHGTCRSGKMVCHPGYKRVGQTCVETKGHKEQVFQLSTRIARYVAVRVRDDCTTSEPVPLSELEQEFGHVLYFEEALNHLPATQYEVQNYNGYFIANVPILTMKCELIKFAHENKSTAAMFGLSVSVILAVVVGLLQKRRKRRMIDQQVAKIIASLNEDRSNDFKYASNFELLETHPFHKHWPEIVRRVESNPAVVVLSSGNGRMWRASSRFGNFD